MLTLLQSWLYSADASGLAATRPEYAHQLSRAVNVMKQSSDPALAIVQLWRNEDAGQPRPARSIESVAASSLPDLS